MELVTRPHIMSDRHTKVTRPEAVGMTVQELVDSLHEIDPRVRQFNLCVMIDDEVIPRSTWNWRKIEDGNKRVRVSAVLHGSGGRGGAKQVLALIAIIIISIYAGPWATSLTATDGALAGANTLLVKAGIMLVSTLAINAIFAPPRAKTGGGDGRSNAYTFNGQQNSYRPFEPIVRVYGQHRVFPDLAALPYTVNVGDDQHFYAVYCFGYGPLSLVDFRIGNNPITNYQDYDLKIHTSFTSASQLELYRTDVFQENFQVEVQYATPATVTTRTDTDRATIDLVFPTGLGFVNDHGDCEPHTTLMTLEYRPYGSSGAWSKCLIESVSRGTIPRYTRNNIPTNTVAIDGYTQNEGGTVAWTRNVLAAGTTSFTLTEGAWTDATPAAGWYVQIGGYVLEIATVSSTGFTTTTGLPGEVISGSVSDYDPTPKVNFVFWDPTGGTGQWSITEAAQHSFNASATIAFPSAGQWTIRVSKAEADSDPNDNRNLWHRYVTALKSYKNVPPLNPEVSLTVVELRIKATGQINGSVERFSAVATSRLPVYDGSSWAVLETRNPAWIYRDILAGSANRTPVDSARIDDAKLWEWAQKCDAVTSPFTGPMGTCDIVVDKTYTMWDLLQSVASTGRAAPTMRDNKYSVIIDDETRTPVQLFTPRNSSNLQSSRTYVDQPHALRVKWVDPQADYGPAEIVVYNDGYNATNATIFEELQSFGMTRPEQVTRWGRYMLAQGKLRQERFSIDVDVENIVCQRGDLVHVAHDVMEVGGEACRVSERSGDHILWTDAPASIADYTFGSVGIRVRTSTGELTPVLHLSVDAVYESDGRWKFTIVEDLTALSVQAGDLMVFGGITSITGQYVVDSIRPNRDLGATIYLEEYAPDVYTAESTGTIPPYKPQPGSSFIAPTVENLTAEVLQSVDAFGDNPMGEVHLKWSPSQSVPYQPVVYRVWRMVNSDTALEWVGDTTATSLIDPKRYELWLYGGQFVKYKVQADYGARGLSISAIVSVTLPTASLLTPPAVDYFNVEETGSGMRRYTIGFASVLDQQRTAGVYVRYAVGTLAPSAVDETEWAAMIPLLDNNQFFTQSVVELALPVSTGTYTFVARTVDPSGALSALSSDPLTPTVKTVTFTSSGTAALAEILKLQSTGNSFVFDYPTATTSNSPDIVFTAVMQNLPGATPTFTAEAFDNTGTSLGAITLTGTGDTRTLTLANFNTYGASVNYVVVTCDVTGTSGTLEDIITIYRLENGNAQAINLILSNEVHIVPTDSGGVGDFTGANTNVQLYRGATDETNLWDFAITATNCTATINGGAGPVSATAPVTVAVSAMAADTAYVEITASRTGYDPVVKKFSLSKSRAGADATAFWMSRSAGAIATDGVSFTPATITFNAFKATGTASPVAYAGRFIIEYSTDGSTYSTGYTSGADESSKTYTPPAGTKLIRASLYLSGGTTVLLDTEIVPVVQDGSDAITAVLSNDSHTLPASNAGVVSSYTGSGTTIQVYEGSTALTFTTAALAPGQFSIGTPVVTPTSAITVGARSGNGTTTATVADHSGMSNSVDAATITYPITLKRADGTSLTMNVVQSLTKAKIGASGTDSTSYWLQRAAAAVTLNTDGTYTPTTLTFNAMAAAGAAAPAAYGGRFKISYTTNGTTYTVDYTSSVDESSKTYTVPFGIKNIKVELYLAGGTVTLLDSEIVPVVQAGTNALTVVLSNAAHSVPGSSLGVVSSYTGSGTTIQVWEGTNPLTFVSGVPAASQFVCGTPVVSPAGSITVGARSGTGTTTATVADHSAMSTSVSVTTITYPLTIKRSDGSTVTVNAVQTISKANAGMDSITAVLAKPSVSLPASSAGVVSSYTGSGTTIQLWEGTTALTFTTGTLAVSQFSIGTPTVSPAASITTGAITGNGTATATVADHSGMSNSTDSLTITYPITVKRGDGSTTTLNLVQQIAKSKQGTLGATGTRGTLTGAGSTYGIQVTAWDDQYANRVVYNFANNIAPGTAGADTQLASTAANVMGDMVTLQYAQPWKVMRGTYSAAQVYNTGDLVISSGVIYRCLGDGVTGQAPVALPSSTVYWRQITSTPTNGGAWATTTNYAQWTYVTYGGRTWLSQFQHKSGSVSLYADQKPSWMQIRGTWSSTLTYDVDDVVIKGTTLYVAIKPSTNQDPATAGTYWQSFGSALTSKGTWTAGTTYTVYDYVTYNANTFVCVVSHVASQAFTADANPPFPVFTKFWSGGAWVTMAQVFDGSILARGSVSADALFVRELSAIAASVGNLTVDAGGWIMGGQTGYDVGTGFFIGYSGGTYKLSIGSSTNKMTWDGSVLGLYGYMQGASSINIDGGIRTKGVGSTIGAFYPSSGTISIYGNWNKEAVYGVKGSTSATLATLGASGAGVFGDATGGESYGVLGNSDYIGVNGFANTGGSAGVRGITGATTAVGIRAEHTNAAGTAFSAYNSPAGKQCHLATASYAIYSPSGGGKYYLTDGIGPFTGMHPGLAQKGVEFEIGDILADVEVIVRGDISNTITRIETTTKPKQVGVCGVVNEVKPITVEVDYVTWWELILAGYVLVDFNGVGEGEINVCGRGGNIKQGDYIVASSMPGKGMRQPAFLMTLEDGTTEKTQIKCGYTVARAREDVTFDHEDQVVRIACFYECGG